MTLRYSEFLDTIKDMGLRHRLGEKMLIADQHFDQQKEYEYSFLRGLLQQARKDELRAENKPIVYMESRI